MAVTSAARREVEGRQGMAGMQQQPSMESLQQQPSSESVTKPDLVVSDLQKRKIAESEENIEVKRVKINQSDSGLRMENIVNEEWKRMSLGIEKQARAFQFQAPEVIDKKVVELKRTIINKPTASASHAKQNQVSPKSHNKHNRWDDPNEAGKGKKHEDDKRSHKKQTKTPPRSYRSPPHLSGYAVWSLRDGKQSASWPSRCGARTVLSLSDDKKEMNLPAGRDAVGKSTARGKSRDIIIIDDEKPKQSTAAKGAEKLPLVKARSDGQPALTTTTTTAASNVPSFKFSWKAKTVKPTLPKPGAESGPMPVKKVPEKGRITMYEYYYRH